MTSSRRRTVRALTWFVLLWPLAQLALVEVAYTNPWRLMGFAMYATDHEIAVTLQKVVAGGPRLDVPPRDLPPEARQAYADFVAKRAVLGRLCSPAGFASAWRRADPTVERIEIDIEVRRLKNARMTTVARDHVSL